MPDTPSRTPASGTTLLLLDVDTSGATAAGETFTSDAKVYRAHARIEDVVIRFPDGSLKLVQRIVPARQLV